MLLVSGMSRPSSRSAWPMLVVVASLLTLSCGDSDDRPTSPSATSASSALTIENFTATSTSGGGGTFNYRTSLRLRETGGSAATITGVSLTLTQSSGVTVTRDVAPAEAFPTTTIAANGTLDSNILSVTGAPIQATQLAARITFAGTSGATGTVQGMTTIASN